MHDPTVRVTEGHVIRVTIGPTGTLVSDLRELADGSIEHTDFRDSTTTRIDNHPLFGDSDTGHDLIPVHPRVAGAMSRFGDFRIACTGTPYHDLLPAVLAQRVTAREATGQWRQLCQRWGEKVSHSGMVLFSPPAPDVLEAIPYTALHELGIDRRRADALRSVARHGERLVAGWRPDLVAAERTLSLTLIPGVGQWTAAVAGWTAFGDADALEVGDFHAKNTVAYALTGAHRGTDEEMCTLLAPYRGQRQRVLHWLRMAGHRAPAHGPRRRILSIARL